MARKYLAKSLDNLFNEIDNRWPNRDRRTDGWYTNSRVSYGHNRNERGLVHAIDVDDDGIDENFIMNSIYKGGDVLWYWIWQRKLYSRKRNWKPVYYDGPSPHTDHMHIEILHTVKAENYNGHWGIGRGTSGMGSADDSGGGSGLGQLFNDLYSAAMNESGRDYRGWLLGVGNNFESVGREAVGGARITRDLRR